MVELVKCSVEATSDPDLPEGFKVTELGPLPEAWEVERLGTVARLTLGRTPARAQGKYWTPGEVPWVSIADLNNGRVRRTREHISPLAFREVFKGVMVPAGTLLLSFKLTIGRVGILDVPATHNEAIASLFPRMGKIDRDFLFYYLQSANYSALLDSYVKGKTLNKEKLLALPVPLPPLDEQRAIAYVLRTVQQAKEATQRVIQATWELKKSLMRHLFTYGPVPVGEAERVCLRETELAALPEHWRLLRLGEVVHIRGGKRLPKGHKFANGATAYPYIRVVDFKNGSVDRTNLKFLTPEDHQAIKKYVISSQDVYISIAGTIGLVGTIPPELDGANLTENAARLVLKNQNELVQRFLVYFLASDSGQKEIASRTTKTSQPKLALARVGQIPIPLPPLPEQHEIVRILGTVDKKLTAEEMRKQALEALFTTLLHNLMIGRIRVYDLSLSETKEVTR